MTWHIATLTSQPSTLLHLTPQLTSWRQNKSHHHHGTSPPRHITTMERLKARSFTQKNSVWASHWSMGKFFLWFAVLFHLKLPPPARPGTAGIMMFESSLQIMLVGEATHLKNTRSRQSGSSNLCRVEQKKMKTPDLT